MPKHTPHLLKKLRDLQKEHKKLKGDYLMMLAQMNEAIAILKDGTDYEKGHILYVLTAGLPKE